jgi:hypothetical protein
METAEKEGAPLQSKHIYIGINAKHTSATSFIYSYIVLTDELMSTQQVQWSISHIYAWAEGSPFTLFLSQSHTWNNLLCCITLLMRGSTVVFDRSVLLCNFWQLNQGPL